MHEDKIDKSFLALTQQTNYIQHSNPIVWLSKTSCFTYKYLTGSYKDALVLNLIAVFIRFEVDRSNW